MSVVIVLVFVAIIMAGAFLIAFIWSVKNGQYDDTYTPSVRILFDDPEMKVKEKVISRSDQSQLAEKKKKESRSDQSQLAEKKRESRSEQSQLIKKKKESCSQSQLAENEKSQ